jgi:CRISPR/Cas system-associated exonuclease Cas4 (RecB family)
MEFTIEELKVFGQCPLKYKYGYMNDYKYRKSREQEYADSIRSVSTWFFDNVRTGSIPTKREIRKKWGSIWHKGKDVYDILFDTSYKYERRRNIKGVEKIDKFYDRFTKTPGTILINNYPFDVPIGNGHILKGRFDIIREVEKNNSTRIELLNLRTDKYVPYSRLRERDLLLTIHDYAYRKTFEQIPDQLAYYAFKNDTRAVIDPMRPKHFKKLETMVNNIASIIDQGLFFPRFDEEHKICRHCDYTTVCAGRR